jgi:imidazole glycerol-phosphate synthase subunit HisH
MIVVVDYGAANLLSITRALEAVGATVEISDAPEVLAAADALVLPGVGAAGSAMATLRASGAARALAQAATAGRPLLGVCLGMQLCFERLAEDDTHGLGLLVGEVPALPAGRKVPHIGWNDVTWEPGAPGLALFAGVAPGTHFYFVHSYHCVPAEPVGAAWTDYGVPVCAAVGRGPLWGVQFHPEKSGTAGLRILENFVRLAKAGAAPDAASHGRGAHAGAGGAVTRPDRDGGMP